MSRHPHFNIDDDDPQPPFDWVNAILWSAFFTLLCLLLIALLP